MAVSASFSVEGSSAVQRHSAIYGQTIDLAILSLSGGVKTITWSIQSTSKSNQAHPTITPAGAPSGATASFPIPSDPGDGLGRAFLVKLFVANDDNSQTDTQYRIVGVPNAAGVIPGCLGEELAGDATYGYTDTLNRVIAAGLLPNMGSVLTGAAGTPGQTITVDQGALRYLIGPLAQNSVLDIDNTNATDNETITIVSLNTAAFTYELRDHSNASVFTIPSATKMAVTLKKAVSGNFGTPAAIRLAT